VGGGQLFVDFDFPRGVLGPSPREMRRKSEFTKAWVKIKNQLCDQLDCSSFPKNCISLWSL